jgi:hypothetical protein
MAKLNKEDPKKKIAKTRLGSPTGLMSPTEFKAMDQSGYSPTLRGNAVAGAKRESQYGKYSHAAPRVGGPAPKQSVGPLKAATKGQVKAAQSMVRKGTGSGASKQAKASKKRI